MIWKTPKKVTEASGLFSEESKNAIKILLLLVTSGQMHTLESQAQCLICIDLFWSTEQHFNVGLCIVAF